MKKVVLALLLIMVFSLEAGLVTAQSLSPGEWAHDIDLLVQKIETYHPRPWTKISQEAFRHQAERMKKNLPGKSDEEIIVETMGLIALLGDGHTRVWLNNQDKFNHWFPVRLEKFAEGFFVTASDTRYADCLGARAVRMDAIEMEEVERRLGSVLSADSRHGVARIISNYLSNAAILKALKILDGTDVLSLELRGRDGKTRRILLTSAAWDMVFNWAWTKNAVSTFNPTKGFFDGRPLPLYLRKMWGTRPSYWFELVAEDKMLYFQFNEFSEPGDEPFDEFIARMFKTYDEHPGDIDTFVIDVRFNEGGDGSLVEPLIREFIKRQATLPRGKLFIISGLHTFSAASNLVGQMLNHTQALTVGDIAAGPLNWCSDVIKLMLPHSRLMVDISTMYWQTGDATDSRGYYPPDHYLPASAEDFFSGRDAVLDTIKHNRVRSLKDILLKEGVQAFEAEVNARIAQCGKLDKWFPYLPNDLSLFALFELVPAGKIDEALAAAQLNTQLYPKDIRAWYALAMLVEEKDDKVQALACLEKASSLEPHYAEVN